MPDYIFRIAKDGILLYPQRRPERRWTASGASGIEKSPDAKLWRMKKTSQDRWRRSSWRSWAQSESHTRKVLETRQLQTFEFQTRDDKEIHHLEVRLTPFLRVKS